ncbi:MAG: hypothetical protein ABI073_00120 [Luteolibacter sp.]
MAWLEARASNDGGRIDEASMAALHGGWYLGKESFRDKLLGLMDKANPAKSGTRKKASYAGGAVRAHNENEVERILGVVGAALDLPPLREELILLKKGDRRKVICAAVAKGRTAVGNDWLAERLAMGHPSHPSHVSTLVQPIRRDKKEQKILKKYDSI